MTARPNTTRLHLQGKASSSTGQAIPIHNVWLSYSGFKCLWHHLLASHPITVVCTKGLRVLLMAAWYINHVNHAQMLLWEPNPLSARLDHKLASPALLQILQSFMHSEDQKQHIWCALEIKVADSKSY